jgi:hypothetical protein
MMGKERHTMKHGISKSLAQEVLSVVTETIVDAYALMFSISPAVIRKDDVKLDVQYVKKRTQSEGLTFLTTTLPKLGDWFDEFVRGHTMERVIGFEPYDGLYPVFLRPVWIILAKELLPLRHGLCQIEDVNPAIYELVRLLRTILHGQKKLEVPFTVEQKKAKLDQFLLIEDELATYPIYPTPVLWRAQNLLDLFLEGYVPQCERPRHGPGAVAGGERGNKKWKFSTHYASLHREFPYYEYHFGMKTAMIDPVRSVMEDGGARRVRNLPLQLAFKAREYLAMRKIPEPTAKLLFVPKDSRGPRVISCEPKELMYIQQGVSYHLMKYIERHSFTKGHVNFINQEINGNLALEASASKTWDTIDLSDASDRVGCELISMLFPKKIADKWFALRSTSTKLEDGTIVPLRKFAPMGSALCFPVESLVFWAISVGCIWECTGDLSLALESVYVYGDDIIIAAGFLTAVCDALASVHLKVNFDKSFVGKDPFRESCGIDALDGFVVTPLRIKKLPPQRPSDASAIAAYVKYAENSAQLAPRRSTTLLQCAERFVGRIPRTPVPQSYLSLVDPNDYWSLDDFTNPIWDPTLCYFKAKLWTIKNRSRFDDLDSWWRLQDALIMQPEGDPSLVVDRSSTLIGKKMCFITYLSW